MSGIKLSNFAKDEIKAAGGIEKWLEETKWERCDTNFIMWTLCPIHCKMYRGDYGGSKFTRGDIMNFQSDRLRFIDGFCQPKTEEERDQEIKRFIGRLLK